jgi:tRNA 5-methylaminomethyl-2-thiouridine biosynthesis bifunctional protein
MKNKTYDYIIVGAGIAGCSTAYFLSQDSDNILIIDKNSDIAMGASGAAGAFLSPLLGKDNPFKTLIKEALNYSISFYKENFVDCIINKGVLRIPKSENDRKKFQNYDHDFEYQIKDDGYFFPIGTLVDSSKLCKALANNSEKLFNYNVEKIEYKDSLWIINNEIKTKNLILTTGANAAFLPSYIQIRPVWGQRIVCKSAKELLHNYHKECSISLSLPNNIDYDKNKPFLLSIGATHHRMVLKKNCDTSNVFPNFSICNKCPTGCLEDTQKLLSLANDIIKLDDLEVLEAYGGARASSYDYFPIVGDIIDDEKTLKEFPYLKHGTRVKEDRFTKKDNLFILNGVGGRGFVLSPYIANILVEYIISQKTINEEIRSDRLFKRWVRK